MRILIFLFIFFYQLLGTSNSAKMVEYVNPDKFLGKWYEIARTYNKFEEGCFSPSIEYQKINDNEYKVYNRCLENNENGKLIEYIGKVKLNTNNSFSSIEKTYFWIFSKDYQIYYLDDYEVVVMSDEEFKNLWIMSRDKNLEKERLLDVLSYLENYMEIKKLIYPKH